MKEQRKLLLKKAIQNGRILHMRMANQLYSSKSSARNAVQSLEFQDVLERKAPGVFEVVKIPPELEHLVEDEGDNSEYDKVPA